MPWILWRVVCCGIITLRDMTGKLQALWFLLMRVSGWYDWCIVSRRWTGGAQVDGEDGHSMVACILHTVWALYSLIGRTVSLRILLCTLWRVFLTSQCPGHFLHFATIKSTLSFLGSCSYLCDYCLSWQDVIQTYPQVHAAAGYGQDGAYRVPIPSPPALQAQPAAAGYFGSYYWWIGEKFAALPGCAKIKCELDNGVPDVVWGFLEWII